MTPRGWAKAANPTLKKIFIDATQELFPCDLPLPTDLCALAPNVESIELTFQFPQDLDERKASLKTLKEFLKNFPADKHLILVLKEMDSNLLPIEFFCGDLFAILPDSNEIHLHRRGGNYPSIEVLRLLGPAPTTLPLPNNTINADWLQPAFARAPKLRTLEITCPGGGGRAEIAAIIDTIVQHSGLTKLSLKDWPIVTDDMLVRLAAMWSLQELTLNATQVSKDAIEALSEIRPDLKIHVVNTPLPWNTSRKLSLIAQTQFKVANKAIAEIQSAFDLIVSAHNNGSPETLTLAPSKILQVASMHAVEFLRTASNRHLFHRGLPLWSHIRKLFEVSNHTPVFVRTSLVKLMQDLVSNLFFDPMAITERLTRLFQEFDPPAAHSFTQQMILEALPLARKWLAKELDPAIEEILKSKSAPAPRPEDLLAARNLIEKYLLPSNSKSVLIDEFRSFFMNPKDRIDELKTPEFWNGDGIAAFVSEWESITYHLTSENRIALAICALAQVLPDILALAEKTLTTDE